MKTVWCGLEIDPKLGEPLVRAYERRLREIQEDNKKNQVTPLEPATGQGRMRVMGQDYTPTE